jgi:hypothetical protein
MEKLWFLVSNPNGLLLSLRQCVLLNPAILIVLFQTLTGTFGFFNR